VVGQHFDKGDAWDVLDIQWSGAVKASYATNHYEVEVRQGNKPNTTDFIFSPNGTSVYVVYDVPAKRAPWGMLWIGTR
jgi:hypothetical protein